MVIAVVVSILLISKNKVKFAAIPLAISIIPFAYVTTRPSRIRRNDYNDQLYFKGENDCGFKIGDYKEIDGVMIPGLPQTPIYKTSNGTDLIIDKDGNVYPAGFGSRVINSLSSAGYLNEAPDECWEVK